MKFDSSSSLLTFLLLLLLLPSGIYAPLPPGTFSYKPDSDRNPESWPGLPLGLTDDGFPIINQCGGAAQSGIDVPTSTCDKFDDYVFSGGSCSLDDIDFTINDHSIVATYNTARNGCAVPRMVIPGQPISFEVLQFHLHTGTDHAIDGQYFGSCMHLVHKEVSSGRLSVLGFFLEPTDADGIGKFSDLLAEWEAVAATTILACKASGTTIWSSQTLPFATDNTTTVIEPDATIVVDENTTTTTDDANVTDANITDVNDNTTAQQGGGARKLSSPQDRRRLPRSFNPYDLIPSGSSMYTYEGSLTTPPCSEIVFWNVIDKPVQISVREFLRLTNLIVDYANPATCALASEAAPSGFTGRPVQAINGRKMERICPSNFVDPLAPVVCPELPKVAEIPDDSEEDSDDSGGASIVTATALVSAVMAFVVM